MDIQFIIYVVGYLLAIRLVWGMGPVFYIPMMLFILWDFALLGRLLSGWDIRALVLGYGAFVFAWILALSKGSTRLSPLLLVLLVDLAFVTEGILPQLEAAGTGQQFWNTTSTSILQVWYLTNSLLVLAVVFESTVVAKLRGKMVDLLINPRKRFLIPIGLWTGFDFIHITFSGVLPPWMHESGWKISSTVLVWGWVALELPFFIAYLRLKRQHA